MTTPSISVHNISDKLVALNYPYSWNDHVTCASQVDYRHLRDIVVFLEDSILRTLPISSRRRLKEQATTKEQVYQALHDFADCSNNTNIVKLHGGGAFVGAQLGDKGTSGAVGGIDKILKDLSSPSGSSDSSDLAAIVLVDRLLDLAIAQVVQDKAMNLEAAHAQWQDEQGDKRNVATLDLSNSVCKSKNDITNTSSRQATESKATVVPKAVAQILALRIGGATGVGGTTNSSSSSQLDVAAQIGAASRFAMGLVDYDAHQSKCCGVGLSAPTSAPAATTGKRRSFLDSAPLILDDDWTKRALSEIPLFGEERVIYDSRDSSVNVVDKKKTTSRTIVNKDKTDATASSSGSERLSLVQNCARALRAIYSEDFSALQRRINVSLARLQELTATCATDAKLGKIGR